MDKEKNNKKKGVGKGNTNNPTGRPPGVPNRVTSEARQAIAMFVEKNAPKLESWLLKVAEGDPGNDIKPNPGRAFELFQSVIEYHIPKLARTEMVGDDGGAMKFEVVAPWLKENIAKRN